MRSEMQHMIRKKMWCCLNKLIGNKKKNNVSDEIIFPDRKSSESKEICEMFNSYFIESIIKINESIATVNESNVNHHNEINTQLAKY